MKRHITKLKQHKYKIIIGAAILIVAFNVATRDKSIGKEVETLKSVDVLALNEIISDGGSVPVVGELKSVDQIDLRPQIPGQVSAIRVKVGDQVKAGQVLVELAHRDLDASVAQASAGLQSALAALEKMRNGARPEDAIIAQQALAVAQQQLQDLKNGGRPQEVSIAESNALAAQQALDDAKTNYNLTLSQNTLERKNTLENAVLAIESAQISMQTILDEDLDDLFDRNNGDNIKVAITEIGLEQQVNDARDAIGFTLSRWQSSTTGLSIDNYSAVLSALSAGEGYLKEMQSFLDLAAKALLESTPTGSFSSSDIASAKTTVNISKSSIKALVDNLAGKRQTLANIDIAQEQKLEAARTRVDQAASQLTNAKEQLDIVTKGGTEAQIAIAEAGVKQAEQQLLIAQNGARPEDIRLQQAAVAQASASLALASAQRDKAILKAPIAGTITYLPVEFSDSVSSSTIAVSIANKDVLEVETFISETERAFIAVGNEAIVNETINASVREIAPALDPVNKKIKIIITITDQETDLTLGETVRVDIKKVDPEQSVLMVPLSAVKLKSTGAEMFIVNSDSIVEKRLVEVGDVNGKLIEIIASFEENDKIVQDARGLKDGETVQIK